MKKIIGYIVSFTLIALAMETPLAFINIPSVLIVFGLTFGGLLAGGRNIIQFCSVLFDKHASPSQLHDAHETAHAAGNYAIGSGFVGTLIGVILMLGSLTDPAAVGPSMAIAILTVLYAVLLKYFIFTPIQGGLDERIEKIYHQKTLDQQEEDKEAAK
jgi:flagellar motor component MotA